MKKFAVVFVFFFLISTVLLFFWISQIKKTQNIATLAKEGAPTTLPLLIDDCNVMFHSECQPPGGLQNTAIIHSIMDTIIGQSANTSFANLRENHLGADFPDLYGPNDYNNQNLSTADMLTILTTHMHINYKLLFALMNIENNSFLNRTDLDPKHPFARTEASALEEMVAVTTILTEGMQTPIAPQIKVGSKVYQFGIQINQGSKTVYSYLASTSTTPEIFEKKVKDFPGVWQKLYQESPVSKNPSYIQETPENELPVVPGEFPSTPDGDFPTASTQSGNVEDLFAK
ncbi:MAG: hypothetical protein ABI758_01545 [Candidatus Woesebacteria bacterium]